ncbi:MAG: hypothetical protein WBA70_09320, partial [Thermodesulfobacteriota bacterium]
AQVWVPTVPTDTQFGNCTPMDIGYFEFVTINTTTDAPGFINSVPDFLVDLALHVMEQLLSLQLLCQDR